MNASYITTSILSAAKLWLLGVWESVQLQRCVVLVVLDKSSLIWPKILQCLTLNGLIFLGSLVFWDALLKPFIHHAAVTHFLPAWGDWWATQLEGFLELIFNVLWLVPAYAVTLIVSGTWYQELAVLAMNVQSEKALLHQAKQAYKNQGKPVVESTASKAPKMIAGPPQDALESVVQEISRSLLFIVFYVEVWGLGMVPYIGRALCFFMLSWLYAFLCFDYSWSSSKVPLHERLATVEAYWPFYAGYGAIMSSTTVLLPFYSGSALLAALFPLFTLVACEARPLSKLHLAEKSQLPSPFPVPVKTPDSNGEVRGPDSATPQDGSSSSPSIASASRNCQHPSTGQVRMSRLPIFFLAWWPTEHFLQLLLGGRSSRRRA